MPLPALRGGTAWEGEPPTPFTHIKLITFTPSCSNHMRVAPHKTFPASPPVHPRCIPPPSMAQVVIFYFYTFFSTSLCHSRTL